MATHRRGRNQRRRSRRETASVDGAYEFVAQSYDMAARRLESIEQRIHTFLVFVITGTIAIGGAVSVTILKGTDLHFGDYYFMGTALFFGLSVLAGVLSNLEDSGIFTINPQQLYTNNRSYTTLGFRKKIIHDAGRHYALHIQAITRKKKYLSVMVVLFAIEGMCGFVWVVTTLDAVK